MLAIFLLRQTEGIHLIPLVKCLTGTLAAGGALWLLTEYSISGGEGKTLLVAKCLGLGILTVGIYLGFMVLTRQEDFIDIISISFPKQSNSDL